MSIDEFIAKFTCPPPPPGPFDDPNYSASPASNPAQPFQLAPVNFGPSGGAPAAAPAGSNSGVYQLRLAAKDIQFFPTFTRDLNKSVKIGRFMEPANESDPTFFPYNTKVVSRTHAEIWEANGLTFVAIPMNILEQFLILFSILFFLFSILLLLSIL